MFLHPPVERGVFVIPRSEAAFDTLPLCDFSTFSIIFFYLVKVNGLDGWPARRSMAVGEMEIVLRDGISVAHDYSPLDNMLKFAHIAWPLVA